MIQRIQSVWLLLASIAAFLGFKLAFFSGNIIGEDKVKTFKHLTAAGNPFILILTGLLGFITFVAIFIYKNRKLQLRITLLGFVLSIFILALYFFQSQKFLPAEGGYNITSIISMLIPFFLIMAIRGINKDQKLIKNLDRLR